jgi:AcrR family transcriptional regulator
MPPPEPAGVVPVQPRPTLREQQKQLTRQKLLEAADEVFTSKGYTRATVDEIVEAAGASRGTYYLYFRSKAEIVTALAAAFDRDLRAWVQRLDVEDLTTDVELRAWLDDYINLVSAHRTTIRFWLQATNTEHDLRQVGADREQVFVRGVSEWIARSRVAAGRPEPARASTTRAMLLVTQLEHFIFSWQIRGWRPVRTVALDALVGMWRRAVDAD